MPRSASPLPVVAALLLAACGPLLAADSEVRPDREKATALLDRYCYSCHGDGVSKGQVALDELLKAGKGPERQGDWMKTWKIVRHEFMPPAGQQIPTAEERKILTAWIAGEMLNVDASKPDPGRTTLRRLNRMEYDYSVQDLFGVNFAVEQTYSMDNESGGPILRLRDRLPPDETAYGFDNIGDFLTLPPTLLERYFEIAEFVVQHVVVLDGPRSPQRTLPRGGFASAKAPESRKNEQTLTFDVKDAGEHRIDLSFTLGGWQEFGGAYDFVAKIDGKEVARERLEVGGNRTYKYPATVELARGKHTLTLVTDVADKEAKPEIKHLELQPLVRVTGPLDPKFLAYPEPHRGVFFKGDPPKDPEARRTYTREILERIATRAYRRPLEPQTLDGLVQLASRSPHFERGIAQALTAILTSSRFLFRAETQPQPNDPAVTHPLDEFALASRLSYFLWLSIPDEELTRLAAAGELRKNLRVQVKRMMSDSKSDRFFEDFPGQWLRTRNVLLTPISAKIAKDLDSVRGSMKTETEKLFEHIARNDLDLIELITANYTFLNKPLADYYGIEGVPAKGFHKVALPPESKRGGILTHGSFLVSTSNPNRTSPVKRGLFVLENLLAVEPPPPPPDVPALDDVNIGDTSKKTGRELLALHRESKSCAACHAHFDPIGIALENYDVSGKWRDNENGLRIDTLETTATGEKVAGLADLQKLFTNHKKKLYHGATEKLLTYALGRGLEPADAVTIDAIVERLDKDGGKFSSLLYGIVESPAFQMRRGDEGGTKASPRNFVPPTPPPDKRRPKKRKKPEE